MSDNPAWPQPAGAVGLVSPTGAQIGAHMNQRRSINASAAPRVDWAGAGTSTWLKLIETPCPQLHAGESGSASVADQLVSSLVVSATGQITVVPNPAPAAGAWFTGINLRRKSDDAAVSNLGYWYEAAPTQFEFLSRKWLYIPFNNVPSPLVEVGDGSGYYISFDIAMNAGIGGTTKIGITDLMIDCEAGNFYTPGTTQIGNSASPGPIGTP